MQTLTNILQLQLSNSFVTILLVARVQLQPVATFETQYFKLFSIGLKTMWNKQINWTEWKVPVVSIRQLIAIEYHHTLMQCKLWLTNAKSNHFELCIFTVKPFFIFPMFSDVGHEALDDTAWSVTSACPFYSRLEIYFYLTTKWDKEIWGRLMGGSGGLVKPSKLTNI